MAQPQVLLARFGVGKTPVAVQALITALEQLFGFEVGHLTPSIAQCAFEESHHLVRVAVRTAHRFVDDLVHQVQGLEAMRRDAQGIGGDFCFVAGFHKIEAQPSGLMTEYTEYCSINT